MSSNDKHKSTPSKLSLLTKHKSQTTFPSFRFSPESEEIQEITFDQAPDDTCDTLPPEASGGSAEGSRASPEPSPSSSSSKQGGDVSPLKEYILKHKWANKWDKRSLSLDLDLKGKIITAIEDKRRSFVSHFYNEEDEDPGLISTSQSIPEQLISTQDEDCDSIHSDSALVRSHGFNFQEENNTDYYEEFQVSSSLPCTPAEFKPTNTITSTIDPVLNEKNLRDLIIEEIGVDCCVDEDMMELGTQALREFVLPPESLRELFQGIPALYNPPAVIGTSRAFPIQEVVDPIIVHSPSEEIIPETDLDDDLSVKCLIKRILHDIVRDSWVKYWIAILGVLLVLNLPTFISNALWYLLGTLGAVIIIGPFRQDDPVSSSPSKNMVIGSTPSIVESENKRFNRSQGWMLTFPVESDNYSPLTHHLRSTKVVFIRIHGYNLLVSYPHSKHKIPKRRLWNDPVINTDHMFVRHAQYNIHGAKIEIVPLGLSKKRVWCKKYPISITLACQDHMVGKIQDLPPDDDSVNFNSKEDGKVDLRNNRVKGQVTKEDCDGRVLFLFARTDREKDDWYRRLIQASKATGTSTPRSSPSSTAPDFNSFVRYMKRACPTLKYASTSPTTPRNDWESVSVSSMQKSSGSSSRKSTPEKEPIPSHLLTPSFLNAFIARLFYDFLKSPRWTNEIRSLIDRKLFFIRKPPFVESIRVKELDLGSCMPVFLTASAPLLDSQGLWVDLEMEYTGNMIITLEMYVNLLKMRSEEKLDERKRRASPPSREHAMFDSDADDSGESSESDEDELALEEKILEKSNENRGKLMKYADSIAKSSVMKNKHVQKVVGNIAATPIILTVEIKRVAGVLAVNLPPVPSDRVWVGFRGNPVVEISARPKFGERALGFSYLTEWIKRKILLEFQRVMVCPNMMDITVGLMEFNLPK